MEQQTFHVQGMTCAACSARVEKVLNKMDHVKAEVNLATEIASVQYDDTVIQPGEIVKKIKQIGYDVQQTKIELTITGMTCASCAARIEKVIQKKTGIINAAVNLATETASDTLYHDLITEKDIIIINKNIKYDTVVHKNKEK